jgi:hypothetical protein
MKKSVPQRDPQYFPFDDFQPPPVVVGFVGPETDDLPWQTIARKIKESTRSRDSLVLTHLVSKYREALKKGEDGALADFWHSVGSFAIPEPSKRELAIALRKTENADIRDWLKTAKPVKGLSLVTNEMRLFLYRAKAGEIKAAQTIVRACPEAIFLPFIAEIMSQLVARHKYEIKNKGELDNTDILWQDFLPKRAGGRLPYTERDLKFIATIARKQDDRPILSGKEGQSSLFEEMGDILHVSPDYLKGKIRIKRGRGRPRK